MIQPHNTDPSSTHNPNWYVVLTKPKQELRAQEHLERQGGVAFVPMFANERIIRGQRVVRQEPLFPGYLFLQIGEHEALLSKVRSTLGVRQLLTFAGQVMTINAKIITVDGQMAMIGSANMDRRSFELNYEVNMTIFDPDFVAGLDQRQAEYVAQSHAITLDEVRNWGMLRRLRNNLMALASPLL